MTGVILKLRALADQCVAMTTAAPHTRAQSRNLLGGSVFLRAAMAAPGLLALSSC